MSSLGRICNLSIIRQVCLQNNTFIRCLQKDQSFVRFISTSKKKNETTAVSSGEETEGETCAKEVVGAKPKIKYFYDYGFGEKTAQEESDAMHSCFFFTVSLLLVGGGFYLSYVPDFFYRDWAQREAFLELRRREKLTLPLIDPNYVDPSTIELPSDEELAEMEIII